MSERESIHGTESEHDDVSNPKMERLARKVAEALYEGDWTTELVTREIATAEDKPQALARLDRLASEVRRALELVRGFKPEKREKPKACQLCGMTYIGTPQMHKFDCPADEHRDTAQANHVCDDSCRSFGCRKD